MIVVHNWVVTTLQKMYGSTLVDTLKNVVVEVPLGVILLVYILNNKKLF